MRFWFQLMSSETQMKDFIAATQTLCDRAAAPGTVVEVRGTSHGSLGHNYSLFKHYSTQEVINTGLRIRRDGGYDAFLLANSLDPGLVALREVLDIPVLSLLEVSCFTACMMGGKFGLIVLNQKFVSRYEEIVVGYGLGSRLATVDCVQLDSIPEVYRVFQEPEKTEAVVDQFRTVARRALERGAEVLITPGALMTVLATRGIHEVDGAPVLDGYSLLVKAGEGMATMRRLTGVAVSRRARYTAPPADLLRRGADLYGIDLLR